MTTLASPDSDLTVKLHKEKGRLEREPLQAVPDTMRWTLRCMHMYCSWHSQFDEYQTGDAARLVGEHHNESTGHPVKLRVNVEFDAGIIRAKGGR